MISPAAHGLEKKAHAQDRVGSGCQREGLLWLCERRTSADV